MMVATDGNEDVHKANDVRSWVLPSAKVPIAWKVTEVFGAMFAVGGEIWIDVSGEESTVIVALPLMEPSCALMIAVPPVSAVTLPPPTLATEDADEVQLTIDVIT